jgi:RNA polymerase sigma-70 factor (ECF subfamily)
MARARAEKMPPLAAGGETPELARNSPVELSRRERIERMVREHAALAARSLRMFGLSRSDTDDGLQEVFMVLARRLDDIRPEAEKAFVFRVAHHTARRMLESRSRKRENVVDEPPERAHTNTPEVILDNREALHLMRRVVTALPDELREVFVLFELEEISSREIASMLDIPRGTVVSRLKRARELVEECMQQHGYGGGAE